MNNNSTQQEMRNFVTKISNFFTILLPLRAYLRIAGNYILLPPYTLSRARAVSKSIIISLFSFSNYHNRFLIPGYFEFLPVAGRNNSSGIFNFKSNRQLPLSFEPIIMNRY
jgi:hypothetical protein